MQNVPDHVAEGAFLESAMNTLPGHSAILDAGGVVLWTNRAWREFARSEDHPMRPAGLGVDYVSSVAAAPGAHASRAAAGLRAVLAGDREQFELTYPCQTTDEHRWFVLQATPFAEGGERYATVVHTEITARRARQRALRDAYEISAKRDWTFDQQVDALLAMVRETLGTEFGTFSRVEGDDYVFEAVASSPDADLSAGTATDLGLLPACAHVVETEQTLVLRDANAQAPEFADPEWGIASYLGAPVTVDGEVYGTFCFYSTEPRTGGFSEWAVTYVDLLSRWVSYELERKNREEKLRHLRDNITDVIWMSTPEKDEIQFCSDAYADVWGRSPETLFEDSTSFVDAIHPDDRDRVRKALEAQRENPDAYEETYRVVQPDGEVRWVHDQAAGVYADDGSLERIVGIATDITARKERERELAQLERLNTLVRQISQALQDAATRGAIESEVCRQLTESDLYQAVWIGVPEENAAGESVVRPRTVAGVEASYLDGVAGTDGLAQRALRAGETYVVEDVASSNLLPEGRRETAVENGHHSLAAVPLSADETTYGVLVVYAPSDQAISATEEDVLADLGQDIALAIQRVHSRRSLTAETAVTLDFAIPDADFVFGDVTSALGCELALERRIAASDGRTIYYLTVHGADTEDVREALESDPLVTTETVVRDATDSEPALLELELAETPRLPLDVLTDFGGRVLDARASDGDISVRVELPPEVEIRALLDEIRDVAPTIELVRKEHVDRGTKTVSAIHREIEEQLSPKQEAALEAAYARGYYEWPRDSTAEDLAETFGVSAPTLHYRLRMAHQTVMAELLDPDPTDDDEGRSLPFTPV